MPTTDPTLVPSAEQLAADLEVCERATPGPWRAGRADMVSFDGTGAAFKNVYVDDPRGGEHLGQQLPYTVARGEGDECLANAAFIARARTAWPDTIRALLTSRDETAQLRAENDRRQRIIESHGAVLVAVADALPGVNARVMGSQGETFEEADARIIGEIVTAITQLRATIATLQAEAARMVGPDSETQATVRRLAETTRERDRLRIPLCIGRMTITRVATEGAVQFDSGHALIAADELFHQNPYDQIKALRQQLGRERLANFDALRLALRKKEG